MKTNLQFFSGLIAGSRPTKLIVVDSEGRTGAHCEIDYSNHFVGLESYRYHAGPKVSSPTTKGFVWVAEKEWNHSSPYGDEKDPLEHVTLKDTEAYDQAVLGRPLRSHLMSLRGNGPNPFHELRQCKALKNGSGVLTSSVEWVLGSESEHSDPDHEDDVDGPEDELNPEDDDENNCESFEPEHGLLEPDSDPELFVSNEISNEDTDMSPEY